MKKILAALASATLLATAAVASADGSPAGAAAATVQTNTNQNGFGTAGCGLGSIVFGSKPGIIQIFAATTNGTFASQTFGITSGTSNCTNGGGKASAKAYIEANREALARDIARGKGETLSNLATVAGCSDSKAVSKHLRRDFKKIFPTQAASNESVSEGILTTLQSGSLSCSNVSG
ncbi:MAG: DUF3015 domain-containing protein [Myxococcales bacterium]|nr:MAG: DUF3015 domain-containing protein [Myxococcales bacterium]